MRDVYEINSEYKAAYEALSAMVEFGDIDQQTMDDSLQEIGDSLEQKLENVLKTIKNKEAYKAGLLHRRDEIKARLDMMLSRIKQTDRAIEYWTEVADELMHTLGSSDYETPDFKARFVGKKASVNVLADPKEIDQDYVLTKTSFVVDKKKAYDDLKAGKSIDGLQLGPDKRLEIK